MSKENLSNKIISGTMWKFSERMISQGVTFVVSMILARILSPSDYGVIAIINIFIIIANVFLVSGLNTALIQKKDVSDLEFNTIFWCNVIIGLLLYLILFFCAPFIASFYSLPILIPTLRIVALKLPIFSYQSIQSAFVSRKMDFKKFFFATSIATIISAIIGISMAYAGFGVWSLIAQDLGYTVLSTFTLMSIVSWKPKFEFSLDNAKPLVKYGWKVMFTDFIGTIFNNLGNLIIGKTYTSTQLAYYSKGKQLPMLIRNNIFTTLISVLFPGMSSIGDDKNRVKKMSRKSISTLSFLIFPMMIGLIVTAEPLTIIMYTEKWLPIVPFVGIMCVEAMISVVGTVTLQSIKAIGRSDVMLRLEFVKKTFLLLSVIIAMRFGVFAIAVTVPINGVLELLLNGLAAKKLIKYSIKEQISDCSKSLISSVIMGIIVYMINFFDATVYFQVFFQVIVGIVIYLVCSLLLKNESLYLMKSILLKKR